MSKQKTILLLGGSRQQIPAIECARRLGHRTVLCDYLRDNPGQHFADKYYEASTTDFDAIMRIAKVENIDGIVAYASDPAAPTAAYVAERLGLPGQPYESIRILTNKELYRNFLKRHGFYTPKAMAFNCAHAAGEALQEFRLPVIIKPVDSCGSKGVALLQEPKDLVVCATEALKYSRVGRFIVEERVDREGFQIAGDGFSVDGKLIFRCFGDDHFDSSNINPFIPIAASFPTMWSHTHQKYVHNEIQRLLNKLGLQTGAYNFDIILDSAQRVYLMEIGPRNGGNYIPQVIRYATTVDLVQATIEASLEEGGCLVQMRECSGAWCYYALHNRCGGVLCDVVISDLQGGAVIETHMMYKEGELVPAFRKSNDALGIVILQFASMEELYSGIRMGSKWTMVESLQASGLLNESQ